MHLLAFRAACGAMIVNGVVQPSEQPRAKQKAPTSGGWQGLLARR
jgi:hypothetical protein